ncbi:WD repeat-containing protein 89-like [Lucilia sericata]|uniref:WD repeat-containing protein 89-like n=1 Tax=Lucilia sericata TaxID=13632 RepID=UPI0018A851F6|nr:WD repeat-containing protein 89-like [Lucilia sericata]
MKTTENNSQSSPNLDHDAGAENLDIVEKSEDYEDDDTCSSQELEKLFNHKYKIHDEQSVTNSDNYVLHLAKDDSLICIAAGLSDGSVCLFEVNTEKGLFIQPPPSSKPKSDQSLCGIRFMDETPNLLLIGSCRGFVRLLDLRTRMEVARFENNISHISHPKEILSFDRNSTSSLLCMGTEQRSHKVNLLCYDIRSTNEIFRFWDCHDDEVTALRFNPQNPYLLCTGSADCLINIYDVKKNEENAILNTINTEDTIYKVDWHLSSKGENLISCITPTNSFKCYNFYGDIVADFDQLNITKAIKRRNELNCNLISCHNTANNDMILITGSNLNEGSTLRSCLVQKDELTPYANFEGNKQIVRDSLFDAKTNILITGGERGIVTLWTPQSWDSSTTNTSSPSAESLKMKTKNVNRFTPY